MTVSWRMQHYNNSCASACMAMLLSQHSIDKQDRDVIIETQMPWLVRLDTSSMSYRAGVLVQDKETFDLMLNRYGLEFIEYQHADWQEYIDRADNLLSRGTPFMTGIMSSSHSGSHAVVFYDAYRALNPDTGLDRAQEYAFEDVREHVEMSFTLEQFEEMANPNLVIGCLAEASGKTADRDVALQRSRKAMSVYADIVRQRLSSIATPDYDAFFRFIIDVVKPIALDLCTAIQISGTNPEFVRTLTHYKQEVIAIQQQIKSGQLQDWEAAKERIAEEADFIGSNIVRQPIQDDY